MISQGYPLFAVDEDGGLHAVVAWVEDRLTGTVSEPLGLRPIVVDASGYLDPMPLVWGDSPLRYFASIEEARRHSNGDERPAS